MDIIFRLGCSQILRPGLKVQISEYMYNDLTVADINFSLCHTSGGDTSPSHGGPSTPHRNPDM